MSKINKLNPYQIIKALQEENEALRIENTKLRKEVEEVEADADLAESNS